MKSVLDSSPDQCIVVLCGEPVLCRNLCDFHYHREWRIALDKENLPCMVPLCPKKVFRQKQCRYHYDRRRVIFSLPPTITDITTIETTPALTTTPTSICNRGTRRMQIQGLRSEDFDIEALYFMQKTLPANV